MLSSLQRRNLDAVVGRVLPTDDAAGAKDAGVTDFIATLLTAELAPSASAVAAFLDSLGAEFADLAPSEQDGVLRERERERSFRLLAEVVHEGFWTGPAGLNLVGFTVTG
jgi:hypothetical protein